MTKMKKKIAFKARVLSVSEVAKSYGFSSFHMRRMIKSGEMPATKIGRTWVIETCDLPKFEKNHEKKLQLLQKGR